jgi:alkylation response protein AidB-like acyl-CoA dehydrogenase
VLTGDSQAVYWTNSDAGTVVELLAGSSSSPTVISSGNKTPRFVTVDANYVYFSTEDANSSGDVGQIRRVPRKGGNSVLISGKQKGVSGLRHSDTLICWIRRGDYPTANGALVCRAR